MCGIAGIIGLVGPDDIDRVRRMTAIQRHRGPDAGRVENLEGAVLGFRRLSIIDLSDRAMQPMFSPDGRYALVFNGEIYNYKELKQEIGGRYPFRSDSDSEVLLAAWTLWQHASLERLNGMFAFCIYDVHTRSAFFARDRFGQKPLHLSVQGQQLLFASEVKGLLAAGVDANPDLATWARYLRTASYDDTESTFFDQITQLLPGECATYDAERGLRRRRYYWVADHIHEQSTSVDQAARRARGLIVDASRIHMRADVPVAIMLSGGLDSSAMLAGFDLASELHQGVKCFSVEFGDTLSERPWIEAAASHHRLPSHIDRFDPQQYLESIKPMMWHLEGPIGGLMNCGLRSVISSARNEGYVVLQDGSGPDEFFAGYRNHHNLYLGQLIKKNPEKAAAAVAEYATNWSVTEEEAYSAALRELELTKTAIDGTVPVRPDLLEPAFRNLKAAEAPPLSYTGDRFRDELIEYMQGSKIPRNMRMVDRLSMGYAMELRLPYLDPRLAEFGLSLPKDYYFLDGRTKGIMRYAMDDAMNDTVRMATKRSIQAPQGDWLTNPPMKSYVEELIHSDSFASRGIFDIDKVRPEFQRFCEGGYPNSFFVWQWINVEEWFRVFVDSDATRETHPLCQDIAGSLNGKYLEQNETTNDLTDR